MDVSHVKCFLSRTLTQGSSEIAFGKTGSQPPETSDRLRPLDPQIVLPQPRLIRRSGGDIIRFVSCFPPSSFISSMNGAATSIMYSTAHSNNVCADQRHFRLASAGRYHSSWDCLGGRLLEIYHLHCEYTAIVHVNDKVSRESKACQGTDLLFDGQAVRIWKSLIWNPSHREHMCSTGNINNNHCLKVVGSTGIIAPRINLHHGYICA